MPTPGLRALRGPGLERGGGESLRLLNLIGAWCASAKSSDEGSANLIEEVRTLVPNLIRGVEVAVCGSGCSSSGKTHVWEVQPSFSSLDLSNQLIDIPKLSQITM